MPTYTFRNNKTNEEWDEFMTIADMEKFISKKHIDLVPQIPNFISGTTSASNNKDGGFNEVMSKITDSSFKMTQSERQKILPYERIGVEGGEVVRQKGLFGVPYADEVSAARDISLAELVYYVNDKKLATKELENIHSSIVESIKKSDIMKNHFLPYSNTLFSTGKKCHFSIL